MHVSWKLIMTVHRKQYFHAIFVVETDIITELYWKRQSSFLLFTTFISLCMITFLDSSNKHILSWDEFLRVSVNPLMPRDACIHQWTVPSLVQIMACCLFGTKPLSDPMLSYFQFSHMHKEHISTKSYLNCKCFIKENVVENLVSASMC